MSIRQCPNNPNLTYDDSVNYFVDPCRASTVSLPSVMPYIPPITTLNPALYPQNPVSLDTSDLIMLGGLAIGIVALFIWASKQE